MGNVFEYWYYCMESSGQICIFKLFFGSLFISIFAVAQGLQKCFSFNHPEREFWTLLTQLQLSYFNLKYQSLAFPRNQTLRVWRSTKIEMTWTCQNGPSNPAQSMALFYRYRYDLRRLLEPPLCKSHYYNHGYLLPNHCHRSSLWRTVHGGWCSTPLLNLPHGFCQDGGQKQLRHCFHEVFT